MANTTDGNFALAVGLSVGSGLATSIGGLAVFCEQCTSKSQSKMLSSGLALSSGVMLYVSFVEIFAKAQDSLAESFEEGIATAITTGCFFAGMGITAVMELAVHAILHCAGGAHHHDLVQPPTPEERVAETGAAATAGPKAEVELAAIRIVSEGGAEANAGGADDKSASQVQLRKTALLTALAIALHNFPEGLATFVATLAEPSLGVALAVAIAVHNIPEGMAVAMPVYYGGGTRLKAFMWASLSGLTEPIGGIIGWLILRNNLSGLGFGVVFAMVGGMMVFIVIHEMVPVAVRYEPRQTHTTGLVILGMVVMALSIVLFAL